MPKSKKPAKKTVKKKVTKKKTVNKSVKKKAAAKKTTKAASKKTKAAAKKTKKSVTKKKATKKIASKKVAKKTAKKSAKKPAKPKATKKAASKKTKKTAAKKVAKQVAPPIEPIDIQEPEVTMTHVEIEPPKAAPAPKEERTLETTMDELEIAPIEAEITEDYMNDEQLEHFRKILIRWKQQLMSEVDSTMGHMQEDGLSFPDPIDRAAQEEGFNLELRTRDRERKLIKKIESALDMIETGDYGFCEDCGAEIGVRRLEARPTATKCIDCKTYAEIRERQSGGS